jgi:hypothetical protein
MNSFNGLVCPQNITFLLTLLKIFITVDQQQEIKKAENEQ